MNAVLTTDAGAGSGAADADLPLLSRSARGDQRALAELYDRHAATLLAYAEGLVNDRELAEEALQDTFLAVWRSGGGFEGRSTVRTWLFGICRRQVLGRVRRPRRDRVPLESIAERPAAEPGPEAVVLARSDAARVASAVARLPRGQREVLDLTFGAGLSQAEIAEVLAVPIGTVKSRLFAARASLARALADGEADSQGGIR